MKRPRLNTLRTFAIAGHRLSFSQAGEELGISQAAVSQQIRNLEAYLGSPLFIRGHRKLSLNPTGVAYLASVSETLDRLDTVTDQLFPGRPNQSVTIGCTSSVATLWLAPRIGAFQQAHPEIDLSIKTLVSENGDGFSTDVDLEIFISDISAGDNEGQVLMTSTIMPVAAPSLLARLVKPDRPEAITDYDLIHVTGYADDWHRWFRTHGLDGLAVPRGLIVDGSLIALEAAMHGDGVALGRRPFIDQYLQSGQLCEVFDTSYTLVADYCLRQTQAKVQKRPVNLVKRWLMQQV